MAHNQNNDYDHRQEEERERRWQQEQRWREDQRPRSNRGPDHNYPQDRWPDFEESFDSIKNHGRPDNMPENRRDEAYHPNRYHTNDRDPRYLDAELRERRERMQHQEGQERRSSRNQFANDRWPDEEDTYERRTRPAGDERYRDERDQYRRYYQDRDHDRNSGR